MKKGKRIEYLGMTWRLDKNKLSSYFMMTNEELSLTVPVCRAYLEQILHRHYFGNR